MICYPSFMIYIFAYIYVLSISLSSIIDKSTYSLLFISSYLSISIYLSGSTALRLAAGRLLSLGASVDEVTVAAPVGVGDEALRSDPDTCSTPHLFVLVGQFLWVGLQGRQVLVLGQVKHLDGAGVRRAGLLLFVLLLFVRAVLHTLRTHTGSERKRTSEARMEVLVLRSCPSRLRPSGRSDTGWTLEGTEALTAQTCLLAAVLCSSNISIWSSIFWG